jgi:uroporphyrinogen III methyltransferase/synthase
MNDTPRADWTTPLEGRSVVVTRSRAQAAALVEPFEALGAEVLELPLIEIVAPEDTTPLAHAVDHLATYDWVVLTSTNGVDRFLERVAHVAPPAEAFAGVKVAAVGSATALRLRRAGIEPDLVPEDFRAEGLVEGFRQLGIGAGTRILVPRALEAREVLPENLREMGAEVDVVPVYRLVATAPHPTVVARLREGSVDVLTFASGNTFLHFLDMLAAEGLDGAAVLDSVLVASVGPITSEAIRAAGFRVDIEAPESTMMSLVGAVVEYYTTGEGAG